MVSIVSLAIFAACPSQDAVLRQVAQLGGPAVDWHLEFTPKGGAVVLEATAAGQSFSRELPAASCERRRRRGSSPTLRRPRPHRRHRRRARTSPQAVTPQCGVTAASTG